MSTVQADLPTVPVPGAPGLVIRSALIDTHMLATILAIPHSTVERMVADDKVPHLKVGKHTRFTPGHIGEIITAAERRPRGTETPMQRRGSARTRL